MDKLTPGHTHYPRISDATQSGRLGYFEITYQPPQGDRRMLCLMAVGFQDAANIFEAYGIGAAIQTREISFEAFLDWYRAMAKRTRESLGMEGA